MAGKGKGRGKGPAAAELTSPVERLIGFGVEVGPDGGLTIPPVALRRLREDRVRRATLSQVPSTPQMLQRDGGGVGVGKGHGAFETLTLESLRRVRERSVILKPIHAARHHQIRRLSKRWSGRRTDVGWRVVHKDHVASTVNPPDWIKPYIRQVEALLEQPSDRYASTTADLLVPLEEDLLTINRPVVERLYSRWEPGRVVGLRPVDGAVVWPTLLFLEQWQSEHKRWNGSGPINGGGADPLPTGDDDKLFEDILRLEGFDLWGAEYCLVRDGTLEAVYQPGDLIVAPMNTRTDLRHAGYPPSHVEEAIEVILSFANVWDYNSSYFTRGMVTEFLLGISGDVHEDDLAAFVDTYREATQGVGRAWRTPIVPLPVDGAITKIDLKPSNREMMYEVFQSLQVALCTAVYRMHPSTINAKPWDGGSGPSLSAPSQGMEIALAQEEGLRCDVDHLADSILTPFARSCHPDLRVVWWYGPDDEQKEATIHEIRARVSMTRNEVRLEQGLSPMGFWLEPDRYRELVAQAPDELEEADALKLKRHEDNLWNQPTDPGFVNQYAMAKQEAAQAQQGPPGPPDGFGGQEDAGGGDGFGGQPPTFPYGQPPQGGQPPQAQPPAGGAPPEPPASPPGAQPMQKAARAKRVTVYVEEH